MQENSNIPWIRRLLLLKCIQLTSFPMRSLWFSMIPHGGIPIAQIFLRCGEARPFSASPTCLDTPKHISKLQFFLLYSETCYRTPRNVLHHLICTVVMFQSKPKHHSQVVYLMYTSELRCNVPLLQTQHIFLINNTLTCY